MMNELIKEINEQCDQAFKVTNDGDYYTLFNLDVEITSGWEDDIVIRLKQIAHENGVIL